MKTALFALREKTIVTSAGVPVCLYRNPALHSFCLSLYARAGVLYENDNEVGVTHFVEHLVFRNINRSLNGCLYELLDENGLSFNAETCKHYVGFTITGIPSGFRAASMILSRLFLPFDPSLLHTGDFEGERGRVIAEIREEDYPHSLDSAVSRKLWGDCPASRLITGSAGDVRRLSLKKCEQARRAFFDPDNFFLYITGNVSDADVGCLTDLLDKTAFPAVLTPPRRLTGKDIVPGDFGGRDGEIVIKSGEYCRVQVCIDIAEGSFAAKQLLLDVLAAGDSCRMFQELSEKRGMIYSYDSWIETIGDVWVSIIAYEVGYKDLYESLSLLVGILHSMKTDITERELSRFRVYYIDAAPVLLDNPEELNRCMAIDAHLLDEDFHSIEERADRFRSVTTGELRDLAARSFRPERLTVGVKGEKKRLDTGRITDIVNSL